MPKSVGMAMAARFFKENKPAPDQSVKTPFRKAPGPWPASEAKLPPAKAGNKERSV